MKRSAAKAALILEQVQSLGKFEVLGDGGLLQATFGEWVRQDQFRLAGFDMDYTLIKTLSGKRFAIDSRDWTFLFDEVPHKLQELNKQNFRVVVFTNQGGVAAGNTSIKDLQAKFSAIHKACNIPMMFLAAIAAHDKHRKPSTGMFAHLEAEYGSVDKSQSFYCGDAAGRLATKTAQKDFSADDLKFAWNTGLKFETPESLFLGQPQTGVQQQLFKPKAAHEEKKESSIIVSGTKGSKNDLANSGQELVILVGAPGSGKSTLWQTYFTDYVRVNNDTLKTPAKCMQLCEESLIDGKSVVIDNTNPTADVRARYLNIAKSLKISARCVYLQVDKETCMHNNFMRKTTNFRVHLSKAVPSIPIHSFFKNHTVPTLAEGFTDIVRIQFVPRFCSSEEEHAYQNLVM